MPKKTSKTGSELFIVDNSDEDWKALRYLNDWCAISKSIDVATGYFEIGSLLALGNAWQQVDKIRILLGDEVSRRTQQAFADGLRIIEDRLDRSVETEKQKDDFLPGLPAIIAGLRSGKIECRVYRKDKFHAKAYITTARLEVVGSSALVGSSNFTYPGLTENIELNVQITGGPVAVLQEWYEERWNQAEEVTPEILKTFERHAREYSPFEIYAKSLQELLRHREMSDREWLENKSKIYPILDKYQRDGFYDLMQIADRYRGAFLCDGVGLGKTFVGLMAIEYLVEHQKKRVALLVPKAARKPVWESVLKRYLPDIFGTFCNLVIYNHSDLTRGGDYPAELARVREKADAIVIDEAHHFRNRGQRASGNRRESRYWSLFNLAAEKQIFMLTATPINNKLTDLQHMIELFTREQRDYFKEAPLGIHSLPGHFRKMEKDLQEMTEPQSTGASGEEPSAETNPVEAEQILASDNLFRALVVQRSRAFVKSSQQAAGTPATFFPVRQDPKVAQYSAKKTYGKLLEQLETAFAKDKPLFSLAIYCPLMFYTGPDKSIEPLEKGRQKQVVSLIRTQFLKRFESSAHAFEASCHTLLFKLVAWITVNARSEPQKQNFERWQTRHADLIGYVKGRQRELFGDQDSPDEENEDFIVEDLAESASRLDETQYNIDAILTESYNDLDQLVEFLNELKKFKPKHDDKLAALIKLLRTDPVLSKHKVLIFTQYAATARYLRDQLCEAKFDSVDEIDSADDRDRGDVIRQFSPYYNGSSSAQLKSAGQVETRILISTDVLSEGLNLQDATRLINYDLHWNPVRLMQRIGRVDRRLNPETETQLRADHPDQIPVRGTVAYWNFLPPDELDELLRLYSRVAHKTLRISKTFGIEGKKLLRPEDDYDALKDFSHVYEGTTTPQEEMHLELQRMLEADASLAQRLDRLPNRVFSGRAHPAPGTQAVFFCYCLPAPPNAGEDMATGQVSLWTEELGETRWYLYDIATGHILDQPAEIVGLIRSQPDTPRCCTLPHPQLSEIRAKVEKHIKNTYLKQTQAPATARPTLKAWMELN